MSAICPRTDRWTGFDPSIHPAGWRGTDLASDLERHCPKSGKRREGYLDALYVLRLLSMPPAFLREADTARFQEAVNVALSNLRAQTGGGA